LGGQAGNENIVLHRDRDPIQRAQAAASSLARGGGLGSVECAVAIHIGEGIQHRLQCVEPCECLIEQL